MAFKFENLEVWQLALEYSDKMYAIAAALPRSEDFNLKTQIVRAGTSVALNIAEGSIGQTDTEQTRFIGMAIRSLIETIACQHLIRRRGYFSDTRRLDEAYGEGETLAMKLQAMRKRLDSARSWAREDPVAYGKEGAEAGPDPL